MTDVMASAVTISEDSTGPTSATTNGNGLKRRQSEDPEQEQEKEGKRQRTSPGKNSPTRTTKAEDTAEKQPEESQPQPVSEPEDATLAKEDTAAATRHPRKRGGAGDEKQRSKRLFGALLGNLNQPGDRTSKRRAEIEQRRKAELQKQDDERLEDRQRRLERLAVHRKKEQVRVDEENMHIRHKNLLHTANYLQTRAEPKLYYRPWDLLPDEEDRIDDQIQDAKDQIAQEVADFKEEKRTRLNEIDGSGGEPPNESTEQRTNGQAAPTQKDVTSEEIARNDDAKPHDETDLQPPIVSTNAESIDKAEDVPESDAKMEEDDTPKQQDDDPTKDTPVEEAKPEEPAEIDGAEPEEAPLQIEDDKEEEADDEGDHVVEGEEDTVIY